MDKVYVKGDKDLGDKSILFNRILIYSRFYAKAINKKNIVFIANTE